MGSSSVSALSLPCSQFSSISLTVREKPSNSPKIFQPKTCKTRLVSNAGSFWSSPSSSRGVILKSVPLATSIAILLWSSPAKAGFLSGLPGLESIPGPQLPQIDFLNRINEENQKKYAENDERFKSSPLLSQLLEKSRLNKEKNRQQIEDKYCIRGAEWGVGDCSAEGMSPADRENFIAALKQKAGVTD